MNTLPKFNEADKYVVTAVNPLTGAVAMETFRDGDYTCYGPTILNDEIKMNEFIRDLVIRQYPVVVTQSKLNKMGLVDYQLVISIHPDSIFCDCGKGIICPLNKQQVNFWQGQVVTREMLAK
jgi:hypothetical protein